MYNPLLDCLEAAPRTWRDVSEEVNGRIERAVRKADNAEAFKWLNVMDLLCGETAAYWRETGRKVYGQADMANRHRMYATGPKHEVDASEKGISLI